ANDARPLSLVAIREKGLQNAHAKWAQNPENYSKDKSMGAFMEEPAAFDLMFAEQVELAAATTIERRRAAAELAGMTPDGAASFPVFILEDQKQFVAQFQGFLDAGKYEEAIGVANLYMEIVRRVDENRLPEEIGALGDAGHAIYFVQQMRVTGGDPARARQILKWGIEAQQAAEARGPDVSVASMVSALGGERKFTSPESFERGFLNSLMTDPETKSRLDAMANQVPRAIQFNRQLLFDAYAGCILTPGATAANCKSQVFDAVKSMPEPLTISPIINERERTPKRQIYLHKGFANSSDAAERLNAFLGTKNLERMGYDRQTALDIANGAVPISVDGGKIQFRISGRGILRTPDRKGFLEYDARSK
ncbi:MAG TPA: hypothetical protein VI958_02230, partial [Acidobacteriota bacterium]